MVWVRKFRLMSKQNNMTVMENTRNKNLRQKITDHLIDVFGKNKTIQLYKQANLTTYFENLKIKSAAERKHKYSRIAIANLKLSKAEYCQMLLATADIFRDSGSLEISQALYSKCITAGRGLNDKKCLCKSMLHRGNLYFMMQDIAEAKKDYLNCKKYASLKSLKLTADYSIGLLSMKSGNAKDALTRFRRVLSSPDISLNTSLIGNALLNTGIALFLLGRNNDCHSYMNNSIGYLANSGDINQLIIAHYYLGYVYMQQSKFRYALKEFDQALKISIKVSNKTLVGLIELAKAKVSYLSKDYKLSIEYLNKAISDFRTAASATPLAESFQIKGMIFKSMKRKNISKGYLEESARTSPKKRESYNILIPHFDTRYLKTYDE
jgi:tetratricopeptide (TPR) repeat protein